MKQYTIPEEGNEISLVEEGERKFDLEDRLIKFSIEIIRLTELMPQSLAGRHLASQLIRSGTAPALNYGEALSAESRTDFIHKMKISLKELRESSISIKIINQGLIIKETDKVQSVLKECNQLIAIFTKSIVTAKENNIKKKI